MKPENYRFVSPKQSAQHQWAAFGMSSRSEFSISTTTQVRKWNYRVGDGDNHG